MNMAQQQRSNGEQSRAGKSGAGADFEQAYADKPLAGQVGEAVRERVGQVKDQAREVIRERGNEAVGNLSATLGDVGEALRGSAGRMREQKHDTFGHTIERVADQLTRTADDLRKRDVQDLVASTCSMARRHPELFLGGAVALGVLIGRFLKSSEHQAYAGNLGTPGDYGRGYEREYPAPPPSMGASTLSAVGGSPLGSTTGASSVDDDMLSGSQPSGSIGSEGGAGSTMYGGSTAAESRNDL